MRQRGARQPRARTHRAGFLDARFPLRRRFEERMRPRLVLDLRKSRPSRRDTTAAADHEGGREGMRLQPRGGFPRKRKQVREVTVAGQREILHLTFKYFWLFSEYK